MTWWQTTILVAILLLASPFAIYAAAKLWAFGQQMGRERFRQWKRRQVRIKRRDNP